MKPGPRPITAVSADGKADARMIIAGTHASPGSHGGEFNSSRGERYGQTSSPDCREHSGEDGGDEVGGVHAVRRAFLDWPRCRFSRPGTGGAPGEVAGGSVRVGSHPGNQASQFYRTAFLG